ncbi:MAG: long-chain fatty acid--CoA ligase [Gammaproteobacteria bacterium]|nr:MAG: long-chain fatty acid--CoA ligase [Gammaproteobacteria bacterium]
MPCLTVAELYDRAVRDGGDRVALSQDGRTLRYRELGGQAARLAAGLQALGLGHGDRVAFLMANCLEYVACEYAVARIGATRVPLAVLLGDDDHVYMMNFARCQVLVYHAKFAARVAALAPRLETVRHFICVGTGGLAAPEHLPLQQLLDGPAATPRPVAIDPEDIAGIYFTGGTTGRPKGVMLSHRAWFHTCGMELLDFDIGWNEVFVIATPMTHASGCLLLPVLLRQGRCVLLERFDPELLLATIAAERATATLVVPTMIYLLLDHPSRVAHDLSSLRNILYGASAIAPERLRQALAAFGPVFTQFFGQTEAPMALTSLPREAHVVADRAQEDIVLASAGRATFGTQIRLVDDDGREVPVGEPGELIARAANVMSGYLDDPQATAAALRDGWLYTGDVARMTADGLITIVDRSKDVIVTGGFNVYPREVEDALFGHPAVRQVAVVGAPHEKWGEEVRALVALHPGTAATAEELIAFVRERKGPLAAPKTIEFADAVPLTNLGKIDRKAIRARYWSGRARMV